MASRHRWGTARRPACAPRRWRALVLAAAVALICWSPLPAAAQEVGICDRSPEVVSRLLRRLRGVSDCLLVNADHLATITTHLWINADTVKPGDFAGLANLRNLYIRAKEMTTYPVGTFDGLSSLEYLYFRPLVSPYHYHRRVPGGGYVPASVDTLPVGIFRGLDSLDALVLEDVRMKRLPAGVFDGLTTLTYLALEPDMDPLPDGILEDLTSMDDLYGGPDGTVPTADAGPRSLVVASGSRVELDGTASDGGPWGSNVAYRWTQTGGPTVSLDGSDTTSASFVAPASATLLDFTLRAQGGRSMINTYYSETDSIRVVVVGTPAPFSITGHEDRMAPENTAWTSPELELTGGEPSGSVTWTLAAAGDAEHFTLDGATGAVSLLADYEDPRDADRNNIYEVTVVATDTDDAAATASFAVEVTDVVEVVHFMISGLADASTPENAVWTSPEPELTGAEPIGGSVIWTLAGPDAAHFSIDPATGVVSIAAQDHESAQDANENNVYEVTVTATDADGNQATRSIGVTVTDVPQDAKTFPISDALALRVSHTAISEADGEAAITALLTAPLSEDVFVTVRTERLGHGGISHFLLGTTTQQIPVGETESGTPAILVPFDDAYYTGDKRIRIFAELTVRQPATPVGALPTPVTSSEEEEVEVVVTIVDDEPEAPVVDICDRTPEVRDAILFRVSRVDDCSLTNRDDLIRLLNLAISGPSALQEGDFADLTGLLSLRVTDTDVLQNLPEAIFSGLQNLQRLYLDGIGLAAVPGAVFAGLSELRTLHLHDNALTSLPAGVFAGLTKLTNVNLSGNQLTTLPEGIFAGMPRLRHVRAVQADGATPFTHLPARAFYGLAAPLTTLQLSGGSLPVHLRSSGPAGFRAVAPSAAPFDIVLPVTVTNGSIADGAATITIPAGRIESDARQVTRTAGTTGVVTADIGPLPALPSGHSGYQLGRAAGRLPATVIAAVGAPAVTLALADTSIAENDGSTTVTAQLDSAPDDEVRLRVFATPRAPAAVFDVGFGPGRVLTIAAQQTASTGTVTITAVDNDVFAWNKEFEISAQVTAGSAVAPAVQTLTIAEDDPRPVVSISPSPARIAEDGGTATLKAVIDTAVHRNTEVRWTLQPVAPAVRSDVRLTFDEETLDASSGVLVIAAGETESTEMVTVTAIDDVLHTGDNSVQVSASVVRGLPWLQTAGSTLTIVDDDPSALTNGICDRTGGVRQRLLAAIETVTDCALVTEAHLAGITDLEIEAGPDTTSLIPGDFAGLSGLTSLFISGPDRGGNDHRPSHTSNITELHPRVFSGLANLRELRLKTLYISSLPPGIFSELSSLIYLAISDTALESLESAAFAGLTNLEELQFHDNYLLDTLAPRMFSELSNLRTLNMNGGKFPDISTISVGAFEGLSKLEELAIANQSIKHLPAGAFRGLTSLRRLNIPSNGLTKLPEAIFAGLSSIVNIDMRNDWIRWPEGIFEGLATLRTVAYEGDDALRNFPDRAFVGLSAPLERLTGSGGTELTVSLESAGTRRFRAVAPSGAPFDMVLPVSVANGSIVGGATTVTIRAGSVHSEAVEVTRAEGSMAAVTTDLGTLPSPPPYRRVRGRYGWGVGHKGYVLAKDTNLPLRLVAADGAAAVTLALSESRIAEDAGSTAVTAALGEATDADITLQVSAAAVAPTLPGDFRLSKDRVLTIAAGQTESSGTVTVSAVDNDRYAGERTVEVAATVVTGSAVPPAAQTLTIEEDDPPPPVELVLTPPEIEENGGRTVVTAAVTGPALGAPITLTVAVRPVADAVASDFALHGATLTIVAQATESTGEVQVTALDNDVDSVPKELLVSATLDGLPGVEPPLSQVLTIVDDDPAATVALDLSDSEIAENDGSTLVTARLDRATSATTVVTVSVVADPAFAGDLTQSGSTLTIAAAATASTGTVRISAVDNDSDEADKRIIVHGAAVSGLEVTGPAAVPLTIVDDDPTPAATLAIAPERVAEDGDAALVTAALDRPSSELTTFTVTATAVPPALATDFTQSGAALTIAAGELASTGTVTLAAADDALYAGNKQVRVTAAAAGGRGVAAPDALTLTIEEDEPEPVITLLLGADHIAEDGGATGVTATLAPPLPVDLTLTVAATPVAPAVATDFILGANRVLTIAAGQAGSTGTVTITAVDDSLSAERKTLRVTAAVSGARGLQAVPRMLAIEDDEPRPRVRLALDAAAIGERAGSTAVRATVDVAPAEPIQLTVAAEPVTPAVAADFRQEGTALAFARGVRASTGTVTVTAIDNDVDAPPRSVRIGATVARGYAAAPPVEVLSITDDEAAPTVNLLLDPAAIGENGGRSRVTARLDHPSGKPTTVTVTTAPVAPALAADFTQLGSTLTIAAGARASTGTVLITALDNTAFGPPRTLQVAGAAHNEHGVTAPAARELAIDEDDAPPLVKIELTDVEISEAQGSTAVMVSLEQPVTEAVGYTVSATPLGAADAGDFSLSANRALTIAAGATESSGTVTLTALPNDVDEPHRTIRVAATGGFAGLPEPAPQELTIVDDDAAPAVTLQVSPSATLDERRAVAAVTAALDHPSSEDTTVRVTVSPLPPAVAADFTQEGTALRIRAGATSAGNTVRITAVDNDVDAPDKTLTVAGEAENGQGVAGDPAPLTLTVSDDEQAPAVRLLLDPAAIGENGGASTVTARLDHRSSQATVVTVTAAPVEPALASHYMQAGSTLTIAAGQRRSRGAVRITAVDDDVYGPTRQVTVTGTAFNEQGVAGPAARSLSILEDEPAPLLTLALTVDEIDEDGGAAGITGTLDRAMDQELTYAVSAAAQATAGGDFTLSADPVLTFPTGATESTSTVTITALANDVDAPDQTVRVAAQGSFAGLPAPQPKLLTILDDDAPPSVTLAVDPEEIDENGGAAAVTAALGHPSSADTTVRVAVAPDAPATAADFTQRGTTLRIVAGERSARGTVRVTALDNDVDAPARTLSITGAADNPQGLSGQPAPVTLTLADDDAAPTVSLLLSHPEIVENGGETTVTAQLDHPASVATTVTVTATPQPPALAADFTQTGSTLTIAPGTRSSIGVVRIGAVNNRLDAPDRTLTVSADAVSAREVSGPAPRTLTIADDEPTPTVALLLTESHLGENGGLTTVTARLDHPTIAATVVTVAAGAVPPALAADFGLSANRALTIAARHTTSTGIVEISTVDNDVDAPDKRVQVSATVTGGNGAQAPRTRTLTILDDEGAPTVSLALTDRQIPEGGTTTLRARLSAATSRTVSMRIAAAPHVTLSDYPVLTILPNHITSRLAVTITAAVDDVDAPDRSVELGTSLFDAPAGIAAPAAVSLRIIDDDDTPAASLVLSESAIGENGGESTVTARLSHPSSADTTVTVAATAGSPGGRAYFARHGTTLTIPSGARDSTGRVRITTVNDLLDAPDRTVVISGQAHNLRAVTGPAPQTLTILDDELLPALTLELAPSTILEAGGSSAVTAALSGPSSAAVTVAVAVTPAAPAVDDDFELSANRVLTIAAGARRAGGALTITAVDNTDHGADKTLRVTAKVSGGHGVAPPAPLTLTVLEDDSEQIRVWLELDPATVTEGDEVRVKVRKSRPGDTGFRYRLVEGDLYDLPQSSGDRLFYVPAAAVEGTRVRTLRVARDAAHGLPRTEWVRVEPHGGGMPPVEPALLTVADRGGPPVVRLIVTRPQISEDGGESTVVAYLHGSDTRLSREDTTVTLTPEPLHPATAADFTVSTTALTIPAGRHASAEAVFTAVNNRLDEANKWVRIRAAAHNPASVGTTATVMVRIVDDDPAPTVRLKPSPPAIGEANGVSAVTAVLDAPSANDTTVAVAAAPVTPASAADFTLGADSVLTIAARALASSGTVFVTARDNVVAAPDKQVLLVPEVTAGRAVAAAAVTLTILDDDTAPVVTLHLHPASIAENGGVAGVTATLDRAPGEAATVTVTAAAVAPAAAADFRLSANRVLTIAADATASSGTVRVTAQDNAAAGPPKLVLVEAVVSGGNGAAAPAPRTLTIVDDEVPPAVTLTVSPQSIAENGGVADVTAALDRAASEATAVTVTATAVAPADAGDFSVSGGPVLTIAVGQTASGGTVRVTAQDNAEPGPPRQVRVAALVSGGNGAAAPAPRTLTIVDDEVAPTVTLTLTPPRIGEAGGTSAVTATYAPPPAASTTVTIGAAAPAAAPAAGFELRGTTLVFAAGVAESSNTVHVAALDDDVDAPDTTVSVTAAVQVGRIDAPARTLTIEDDDPTPVLTLALSPEAVDEGGVSTVTAALDRPSSAATVVTVAAAAQEPTQATDFALSANAALTIASGARQSTGRVWIEAVPNSVDEAQDTRSVTVSARVSGGRGVQPPAPRTLTIRDDDRTIRGICGRSRRVRDGILEQLDGISNCGDVTAEHLGAVRQLHLAGIHPRPHSLQRIDFAGLTNLTYLDLSYAQLGSLPAGIFAGLSKLEYLGLTRNGLTGLAERIFHGLRNLHVLDLADNGLTRLPATIFRDVDLWELDLGQNHLVTLPANVFAAQNRLTLLDLTDNRLASLPSEAFAGLSALRFLLLHRNELTSLPAGIFADMRSLRRVYLVGNRLASISADQLRGMPVLEILDLRGNELTTLAASTFIEVSSVGILRLIGNKLTELPVNVFHPLRRLRHLYLYDNQLSTLPAGIFSRNLRLWTVELYGNPLTSLPAGLLSGLPELRHVRLGAPDKPHHLSRLPERTFADLPAPLRSLNLFSRDHGASFPLEVSLRSEGSGRFRAVAAYGAPFDIVLPISVTNGTIDGGATTVTIAAGAVRSAALQVTRVPGTTAAIDADIGALPALPHGGESRVPDSYDPRTDDYLQATTGHWGYQLTKAVSLPVAVDERPVPRAELVLVPPAIAEDGGVSRVTARLASAPATPVTLAVSAVPVAPALAGDFKQSGMALTIAAGDNESTGTVTVTGVADDRYVPNKRVSVTAEVTAGPAAAPLPRLLAIGEDDAAPVVSLRLSAATVAEDGGVVEVTAALGHAVRDDVTVTVAATPAAPARHADIRQVRTRLWIPAGSTASSTTVRIEAVNNQVDEPDKTVQVAGTVSGVADLSAPAPRTFTIEDDDEGAAIDPAGSVPRVSLELSRDAIGEKEGSTVVTARLDRRSGADTTVQVTATALQPPSGEYFTQAGTTLTIRAGADRSIGTVTITASDDIVDNPHRTVRVAGAAGNADGVVDPPARTLTIVDDELLPALALALSQSRISENGGSSAVTASLSGGSSELLEVTVAAAAAGVAAGGFELSADPVLTVAAHATAGTGTVTVTGRNDEVYTGDRTVAVSGTVSGGNGVAAPAPHELTIVDDETPPTVTLLLSADRIDENGGRTTVTASLSGADLGADAVLTVAAAPDAPATVGDFTQAGATLTIAAGRRASTGTVTITAHDNELDGPHKTVQVAASSSGVPGLPAPAARTLTIVDDDATPALTLVLSPQRIGENGGVSVVTATLSERSGVATTLTVAATPHEPAAGSYFVQHGTTLTIAAGHTASAGTVRIAALDDDVDSPDKTVRVAATVAGGNGVAAPAAQFLTILDGETTPRVSLVLAPPSIAENGGASLVQATLDRASSEDTTLAVAATPHAPAAGSYFVQHGTTLTITAGHTASAGTVRIAAVDDDVDSPAKTVRVAATVAGGNGAMAPAPRVLEIRDDDATPTLELELAPERIGEAQGESVITATLSAASSAATTLWITAAPDPPATVDDFTLSANLVLTIAAGQTASSGEVKVTAVDDAVDAPDKTLQVAALVSGGNGVAAPAATPLTIADDEPTPTAALELSADTIGENGGVATVWATLSGVSSEDAVVTVAAQPLDPPAGQYFTQTGATLTIAAGEITSSGEVKIVAQDDEAAGPDKRVRVTATISGGNGIAAPAARELKILDGEATPVVELALSAPAIGEHGGVTTVTARLPHASTRATTLTVAVTAVAPAAPGDFALSPNRVLTIAALATSSSGTVTVTGVDNDVDAPDKNLWVTAVVAGGDGVAAPQRKALKILDDEATPVVTLKLSDTAIGETAAPPR